MAVNLDPFNLGGLFKIAQRLISEPLKKALPNAPTPTDRKGTFGFGYPNGSKSMPDKWRVRPFEFRAETLAQLAKTDPVTGSIIRTIKAIVNQTEWDIEIDTEAVEKELSRWEDYALSHLSPYAIGELEQFESELLEDSLEDEIQSRLKAIMAEPTQMHEKKKAIQWYFASVVRQIRSEAESHRALVKPIFEVPSERGLERNFRTLQDLVLDDILIFDAGCIAKNYSRDGFLAELYHVPGQYIRLNRYADRTFPEPPEPTFMWEELGTIHAEFTRDEMLYIMQNPQENAYGRSPIELAAYMITATLYADEYNIDFFKHSNVPPGVFNLGKDVTPDARAEFQQMWESRVRGRGGMHQIMFLAGSENPEFIQMQPHTNRDMQMLEFIKWTTAIKTACFGISGQDIGLVVDYHKETSDVQRSLTYARGVKNILQLLEEHYNSEIVKKEFQWNNDGERVQEDGQCDVKFAWKNVDSTDEEKQARIDILDIQNGVISRNDRRKARNMRAADGGDALTIQAPQLIPLVDLERDEEGQEDINEQADANEQAGGQPTDMTESPTPGGQQSVPSDNPQQPPVENNVNLSVNRRKSKPQQEQLLKDAVDTLKAKGIDATLRIGFVAETSTNAPDVH